MSHLIDLTTSQSTRVLCVEGCEELLDVLVGFLQRQPELAVVGAVRDVEEAVACVHDLQPHVILVDLDVPSIAGLELIPRLRVLVPKARIIGFALSSGNTYRRAALASGVDAMVSKGDMVQELLPAIRRVAPRNPTPDLIGALAGH